MTSRENQGVFVVTKYSQVADRASTVVLLLATNFRAVLTTESSPGSSSHDIGNGNEEVMTL